MTVVVSAGQSLIDVCLQQLGDVAALFELADANGLTITSPLHAGQLLTVPEASQLGSFDVATYYAARQQRVNVPDPMRRAGSPVPPAEPADQLHDFLAADFLRTDLY
jgi:hypothetical protein